MAEWQQQAMLGPFSTRRVLLRFEVFHNIEELVVDLWLGAKLHLNLRTMRTNINIYRSNGQPQNNTCLVEIREGILDLEPLHLLRLENGRSR